MRSSDSACVQMAGTERRSGPHGPVAKPGSVGSELPPRAVRGLAGGVAGEFNPTAPEVRDVERSRESRVPRIRHEPPVSVGARCLDLGTVMAVYLDCASTTPVHPAVRAAVTPFLEE